MGSVAVRSIRLRLGESRFLLVAFLLLFGCAKHLIVLRFVDAFLVHLRGLASSFGIFIFTERIRCLVSGRARHGVPTFGLGDGCEVLFLQIDFLFSGQLAFGLLIVRLGRFRRITTVDGG